MPKSALCALLLAAGGLAPAVVMGQGPMDLATAGPQPHFVAAWAPEREREAEHSAALARRVSLELQNVSLDAALKALTNQAGLRITYSKAVLPAGKRVTIKAGDIAVITALTEMLFRSGLDVVVDQDGTLALVRCKHVAPRAEVQDSGTIVGIVTDKATRAPIAGATVALEGTNWSATTNAEGRYRIAGVVPGTYTLGTRYIGYAKLERTVSVGDGREVAADFALEKSVHKLDELVTTGTLVPTEAKALPTPINIITSDQIALQQPRYVGDLIRQVIPTAIAWENPVVSPTNTFFQVRGATTLTGASGQMKVFVDGIEAADRIYGGVDPSRIERVEVIRGPQAAAIYGSDAIGGVIQIFTKRGSPDEGTRVNLEAAAGVNQTPYDGYGGVLRHGYAASVEGGGSEATYHLDASYSHTGAYAVPDGQQSNYGVAGGVRFTRGIMNLDLSGRYFVHDAPNLLSPQVMQSGFLFVSKPLHQPYRSENQTLGLRLDLAATPWWRHQVTVGVDRFDQDQAQTKPILAIPDDTLLTVSNSSATKSSITYHTAVQGSLSSRISGTLTAGFDYYRRPNTFFFNSNLVGTTGTLEPAVGDFLVIRDITTNTGYFGQAQAAFDDALFLTAGLRAEQNSGFGDSLSLPLSPRLGISYVRPAGGTTLKFRGSWGRAIRAPGPGAKNAVIANGFTRLANPRLGPERQRGWDAGIDLVADRYGSFSATYYDQTSENLIQLIPDPATPFVEQYQNVGEVRNFGVEFEATANIGPVQIRGQYGYARARIDELAAGANTDLRLGDQVRGIPKHTAGASLAVTPVASTTISAGLTYVGTRNQYDFLSWYRCLGGTAPCRNGSFALSEYIIAYPAFTKVDVTLSQQLLPQLSGFLRVENATNNDAAEELNTTVVTGRVTTLGLRFTN
jgi:iron complex outermembrane recepter protein